MKRRPIYEAIDAEDTAERTMRQGDESYRAGRRLEASRRLAVAAQAFRLAGIKYRQAGELGLARNADDMAVTCERDAQTYRQPRRGVHAQKFGRGLRAAIA